MASEFKPPSWAGDGEAGLHLDVMKEGVLIGKFAIDKKVFYLFGRNPDAVDFAIDHVSCSRVHAALVHHKALKRPFLLDLGSTHGTFVGNIRLEPNKPQQLFADMCFHFGASTRQYFLREKEKPVVAAVTKEKETALPTSQAELDTLTIYNTGQNLKLSDLAAPPELVKRTSVKRKVGRVSFRDEEDIINLEDCDPSVGRFQNLVATEIVSPTNKKFRPSSQSPSTSHRIAHSYTVARSADLYGDLPSSSSGGGSSISLPNSAPEVDSSAMAASAAHAASHMDVDEDHHKKYAKEVWPGRKISTSPAHL
ncbi:Nuclear inhibitor of protein phosphatase 1 [Hypsibius exemplaris]|uniref:Nuclear inhibitor of protein phosphatase 1 n=1 Tax=Hypsibius exemplaris TaxID=2072580 RepID=A0A9X6NJJ3_HYPEX|nr:Nuclear inhibitor of protein phosphatase 1 [Hypsibius exemplaris]